MWVLKHWFWIFGVCTNFYGTSTVLFDTHFLTLFLHSLFRFRARRCPAAVADTEVCDAATTQPSAQAPSTHQVGWCDRLVWVSLRRNPLKYPSIYRVWFWRFFLVSVSDNIIYIIATKLLLNAPLLHQNLPLILMCVHCGIIGGISNQPG